MDTARHLHHRNGDTLQERLRRLAGLGDLDEGVRRRTEVEPVTLPLDTQFAVGVPGQAEPAAADASDLIFLAVVVGDAGHLPPKPTIMAFSSSMTVAM